MKKFLCLLFAFVLAAGAFALAACGGGNKVTVSFDLNYAGATGRLDDKTVTVGKAYGELPSPTRANFTFRGWHTRRVNISANSRVTEETLVDEADNHTLFAQWLGDTVAVSYDLQGGTCDGVDERPDAFIPIGEIYGLDAPEAKLMQKEGYVFIGWYLSPAVSGERVTELSVVSQAKDHTLYAVWLEKRLSFDFTDPIDLYFVDGGALVQNRNGKNWIAVTSGGKNYFYLRATAKAGDTLRFTIEYDTPSEFQLILLKNSHEAWRGCLDYEHDMIPNADIIKTVGDNGMVTRYEVEYVIPPKADEAESNRWTHGVNSIVFYNGSRVSTMYVTDISITPAPEPREYTGGVISFDDPDEAYWYFRGGKVTAHDGGNWLAPEFAAASPQRYFIFNAAASEGDILKFTVDFQNAPTGGDAVTLFRDEHGYNGWIGCLDWTTDLLPLATPAGGKPNRYTFSVVLPEKFFCGDGDAERIVFHINGNSGRVLFTDISIERA